MEFGSTSPIECQKLNLISIYSVILFFFGILVNSTLIWVYNQYDDVRRSLNRFIIVLTILNLIGCFVEMPFVIISNYLCKYAWIFVFFQMPYLKCF